MGRLGRAMVCVWPALLILGLGLVALGTHQAAASLPLPVVAVSAGNRELSQVGSLTTWNPVNANGSGSAEATAVAALIVTEVTPASAPNDLDTPVVITGDGFEHDASARLGDLPLPATTWVSATCLEAIVPWGLPPAVYTLTVTNPDSTTASLSYAFTVTPGINVWTHGGPYGGVIGNLVLHPLTPTVLYAAAWGSGVFLSEDGAAQWRPSLITAISERPSIDPHNPQWIYSGGHNNCLRSQDGGRTWDGSCTPSDAPTWQYPFRFRPVVNPAIGGLVYLGLSVPNGPATAGHLYRSNNGGDSWLDLTSQLPATDTNVTAIAFDSVTPATMAVGTRDGYIYTSTDGGDSWSLALKLAAHVERLVVNPFGAHEVWAVTNGSGYYGDQPGLWRSVDLSLTQWIPITVDVGLPVVQSIAFHPAVSGTVWVAAGSGYVSTDGGLTWGPVGADLSNVLDFAADPEHPDVIYAGTMRGVFKSTDRGQTWATANTGLAGIVPNLGLATSSARPDEVYAAADGRVFRSFNGGQVWDELETSPIRETRPHLRLLAVDPFTPTRVYLGDSGRFQVYISDDRGQSWIIATLPPPPGAIAGGGVWVVAPHPTIAGQLLAGAGLYGTLDQYPGALYQSQDYGASWTYIDTGLPISGVLTLAYDPAAPQIVYAGTEGGGLLKSLDAGQTWQPLISWMGGKNILAVAVHPTNHKVFVSTIGAGQAIYVSDDGGQTWSHLAEQPTTGPVWELLYTHDPTPILYAGGMEAGLHYSTDEGLSWTRAPGMPGAANVPSLASAVGSGRVVLYVGTSGGAVTLAAGLGWPDRLNAATILLGAGVYRQTRVLPTHWVYLPLVRRQ